MKHASLFTGFGGFDLAAEEMGWDNVFYCENADFPLKVLNERFPDSKKFTDVRTTSFIKYRGLIDVLSGGFPCQPFSVAGKREGTEDPRHLWPEYLRAIQEIQPRWVIGENVSGLISWSGGLVFEQVCTDLEAEGFEVVPFVLPAAGVNAPHRRDRVWFVAHRADAGDKSLQQSEIHIDRSKIITDPNDQRLQKRYSPNIANKPEFSPRISAQKWSNFPTQSPVCGGNDGISNRLERYLRNYGTGALTEKEIQQIIQTTINKTRKASIMGFGNAIVPQVALQIFKAIEDFELL